ncbi:MAG: glycosyltransferase family 2 protein, partial [Actinomycetota bacterium]
MESNKRMDAPRRDLLVRAISLLAVAAAFAYVGWRITTLATNAWLSIPLFVVELWGALQLALLVMQGWTGGGRPERKGSTPGPVTTIVTATFHSPDELERTLIGCRAMATDGPIVVALREGRDDLDAVCDGFEVHRLTGTGNHVDLFWLAVEATGAPLAAWLEAGQVPMHDFVTEVAGGLDHGVAVVQASIGQLNKDSLAHVEGGRDEHAFRQNVAYPGMSRHGTAPWFGGGSVIRTHAITETGGFDREDQAALQRSLVRLHAAGWTSRYVADKLVRDNAPDSMEAYLHRRRRAAIETLRVFRTPDNPLRKRGLGLAERASHVALALAFTTGARQLALTAVLITTLATGAMPIGDDAVLWSAIWIPTFATGVVARWAQARGVMRIGDWTKQAWRTVGADLSAFADVLGLTKRPRAFSNTSTTGMKVLGDMRMVTATLVLLDLALVLRGLTMFWPRMLPRFSATGRVMALLIGLVVVIGIVDVLQVVVRRRQRRAQYRLNTRFIGYVDGRRGDVIDLAPSGAGIHISLDTSLDVGDEVTVEMAVPLAESREVISMPATVRSLVPMDDRLRVGVSFGELGQDVRSVLVQYCAIDHHRDGADAHKTSPGDFDLGRPRGRVTRSLSGSAVMAGVVALFFGPAAVPALADVASPASACLVTSTGEPLAGGHVRFHYDGSWHDVGTTGADGCVTGDMPARKTKVSVNHRGIDQSVKQDLAADPTVIFTTVPVTVSLTTSIGDPVPGALAQFHASGWQDIGLTGDDGEATTELLASKRSFRITHDDITNSRKQNTAEDPVVTFATVPVTVSLTTSTGDPIAGALAQYHAAGWKDIGPTGDDGTATTEMLPSNRSFRVTHDDITNSRKQNIADDPLVAFDTIPVTVSLATSTGEPIAGAAAQYHSAGWKDIGPTGDDGTVTIELLRSNRSFRVTHDDITNSRKQDTAEDATISFATIPVTVGLTDSSGTPIAGALA